MKPLTQIRSSIFLLLLIFLYPQPQFCKAADQLHVTVGKSTRIPYVFKETSFQGRFDEAMNEAKDYDVVPMEELLYDCHNDPSGIYERLKPYVNDPSDGVKYTIMDACGFFPLNPQALKLLTKLVPDYNLTDPATRIFYNNYTSRQIAEKGGSPLKHALFQAVFKNGYVTYGYLLLTCFKKDPAVYRFLERRRKTFAIAKVWKDPMYSPDRIASNVTADALRDTTREAVSLDLALIQWGDEEALARIKGAIAARQPGVLMTLLRFPKFVTNKTVLLGMVELLKDRDRAHEGLAPGNPPVVVQYSRVCDEALVALYKRAKFPLDRNRLFNVFMMAPLFTDQELTNAYQRLKVVFNAEAKA